MKKFYLFFLLVLISTLLIGCKKSKKTDEIFYYVHVSVNPAIDFIVNQDERVVGLMPLNDDGAIILAGENYMNQKIDTVISDVIENAYFTGYLDSGDYNQAITIGVMHPDSAKKLALETTLIDEIQDALDALALEAFILNTQSLSDDVMDLIDTYDLTLGHALLLDTYMKNHPSIPKGDIINLPYASLIQTAITDFTAFYETYKADEESALMDLKAMLIQDNAYLLSTRETEGFERTDHQDELSSFLENKDTYVQTKTQINQIRVSNAEALVKGLTPSYLLGEYAYEMSTERMPYQIIQHTYELHANGTYTESSIWHSWDLPQTVSGTSNGTWE